MITNKKVKPPFYKSLMKKDFYPHEANLVKYFESTYYWIFKTGIRIYKIRKRNKDQIAQRIEEILSNHLVNLVKLHSPDLNCELSGMYYENENFIIRNLKEGGSPIYYVTEMDQLSNAFFFDAQLKKNKVDEKHIERLADFLFQFHQKTKPDPQIKINSLQLIQQQLDDIFYQSKKHLGKTLTQPMVNMSRHPLEKFLTFHKKIFNRRSKCKKTREIHGRFVPEKIFLKKDQIILLPATFLSLREQFEDVALDIANFTVELRIMGKSTMADEFVEIYSKLSNDRDLHTVVLFYEAKTCLKRGLELSILMESKSVQEKKELQNLAVSYYEEAVTVARLLN